MDKSYTIPVIDISEQISRQTIVDKEKGVYLGHTTSVLLEDGKTIIIVYPKNHGNGQIVMKRSSDGGLTWSERLDVPDSWSTSLEVPTIFRTYDANGNKHLIMFSGLRPIRMAHSEDDGFTWSELEPIADGKIGGIVAMGDIKEVGKGHYIAMFHDDGRFMSDEAEVLTEVYKIGNGTNARTRVKYSKKQSDGSWLSNDTSSYDGYTKIHEAVCGKTYDDGHFILYQIESFDGGITWSGLREIATHPTAQICEPAIIRSPDGNELTVLLRENSRRHNGFKIISRDNGKTWSDLIELPAALTGDRHCARYLNDGRLFISFRDTTLVSETWGDWVAWVGTYEDIANGREGQYRVRLMKNYVAADCAYPAVDILPDGTVVTETYGHWEKDEQPYIMCVRIHPNELDSML